MNAVIRIQGDSKIQVDDASLAALNAVLATTPVVEERWSGNERVEEVKQNKRMKLEAFFEIRVKTITVS